MHRFTRFALALVPWLAATAHADTAVNGPYSTVGSLPLQASVAVPRFAGGMEQLRGVAYRVDENASYTAFVNLPQPPLPGMPPSPVSVSYMETLALSLDGNVASIGPAASWSTVVVPDLTGTGSATGTSSALVAGGRRARSTLQAFVGSGDVAVGLDLSGASACSASCNVSAFSSLATTVTYEFAPDGLFFDTFD